MRKDEVIDMMYVVTMLTQSVLIIVYCVYYFILPNYILSNSEAGSLIIVISWGLTLLFGVFIFT